MSKTLTPNEAWIAIGAGETIVAYFHDGYKIIVNNDMLKVIGIDMATIYLTEAKHILYYLKSPPCKKKRIDEDEKFTDDRQEKGGANEYANSPELGFLFRRQVAQYDDCRQQRFFY